MTSKFFCHHFARKPLSFLVRRISFLSSTILTTIHRLAPFPFRWLHPFRLPFFDPTNSTRRRTRRRYVCGDEGRSAFYSLSSKCSYALLFFVAWIHVPLPNAVPAMRPGMSCVIHLNDWSPCEMVVQCFGYDFDLTHRLRRVHSLHFWFRIFPFCPTLISQQFVYCFFSNFLREVRWDNSCRGSWCIVVR